MSRPMGKPLLYGIFIIKFLFGLGLIIWTVMMTMSSDVGEDEDNAFLSTYQNVNHKFNDMVDSNYKFEEKYNLTFYFNDEIIKGLTVKDVFLSQRVIKSRKIRKDILKLGTNTFKYELTTKDGQKVQNIDLKILVTMATNHVYDKNLEFKNSDVETFEVIKQSFWNITGTVEVADYKGYFFIKTNAR